MVVCFMGKPGSGKSYDAVVKILDNIKMGRRVYTNIDGFEDKKCQEYQKAFLGIGDYDYQTSVVYLNNEQIVHFWDFVVPGSLVVVDEVHKWFSNREWDTPKNKTFASWVSTHRKQGYDLLLITQDIDKIDKHAKTSIDWTYEYRKVTFMSKYVKNTYLWYAYNDYEVTGKALKWGKKSYNKYIFMCYKSYVAKDIKELHIMSFANIFRHPVFYALPLVLLLCLYMFHKSSFSFDNPLGVPGASVNKKVKHVAPVVSVKNRFTDQITFGPVKQYHVSGSHVDKSIHPVPDGVGSVLPAPVVTCRLDMQVISDDGEITGEVCGNRYVQKINGIVVKDKIARSSRPVSSASPVKYFSGQK